MKIDKMRQTETEAVSQLVVNAFYSKFSEKTDLSKERLQKILKLIWLEEADQFGLSIYTVKLEEEIVGAFGFSGKQRFSLSLSLIAKVCAVVNSIGVKAFLSFLRVALQTHRKPNKREWYIDFIVVKEAYRNQSIGHTILSSLEERADQYEQIDQLSLYVLKGNDRARHLYEKYGFSEKEQGGIEQYQYMVKNLGHR
ncbi:GNAT family N-acetyltransferase [Alkalibacterium olivapovliticus]|uniref:Acetyltransferase (GNAT) family protein n=1 Tax=Alkalibacterium olivapovliticus TaxID=99907 RepID=A0A2T0W8F9_9LACT|nr:N-acetyltransferase [Alkalibacterium olivapovliticus]PRY83001.1 acetyltransferase (GNAT) family protein [Alkalibacterium olivapovliticus]